MSRDWAELCRETSHRVTARRSGVRANDRLVGRWVVRSCRTAAVPQVREFCERRLRCMEPLRLAIVMTDRPVRRDRLSRAIVGRTDEIHIAERMLDDVTEQPRALLIEGEPGIGKTTLFDGLLEMARD